MRRLLFMAIVASHGAVGAQAPVRYRVAFTTTKTAEDSPTRLALRAISSSSIDTAALRGLNGQVITITSSILSLTTRDSADGKIWRLASDSLVTDRGEYGRASDRVAAATTGRALPIVPPQPRVYEVFIRNGDPVSMTLNGSPMVRALRTQTTMELLYRLPGLGLLIPSQDIPTRIGQVRPDTLTQTGPSTINTCGGDLGTGSPPDDLQSWQTDSVIWGRISRDTVDAIVARKATRTWSSGGVTMEISGTLQIIYDAAEVIRVVKSSLTMSCVQTSATNPPQTMKSKEEYLLVRIP